MERELALLADSGAVIRDAGWRCVADVMASFHGFGVRQVYGIIVYADTLEPYPPHLPDPEAGPRTSQRLG